MDSNGDIRVAESAFVSAVAEALTLQHTILELRMQLQQAAQPLQDKMLELHAQLQNVDERAAKANDAALRELGFDEMTPVTDILDTQERFLVAAIDRAGLPEDAPVVKAARQQIKNMRDEAAEMVRAGQVGGLNGPPL